MNDKLFDRVIQELELKEYNLKQAVHATPIPQDPAWESGQSR